jgi:hypothetical protein
MSHEQQDDEAWLEALQGRGPADAETLRIRAAIKKRAGILNCTQEQDPQGADRLRERLIREGLFNKIDQTERPSNGFRWFHSSLKHPLWLGTGVSLAVLTTLLVARTPLWMAKESDPIAIEPLPILRGIDIKEIYRIFPDLPLAGHQFQIIENPALAESEWEAALIEAGVTFKSSRSALIPNGVEIHLRLTDTTANLPPPFSLHRAPTQGEWVIFLLPKTP